VSLARDRGGDIYVLQTTTIGYSYAATAASRSEYELHRKVVFTYGIYATVLPLAVGR